MTLFFLKRFWIYFSSVVCLRCLKFQRLILRAPGGIVLKVYLLLTDLNGRLFVVN